MFYDTKFVAKYKGSVKCDKCAQNIDPKKGIYHCPVGGCDQDFDAICGLEDELPKQMKSQKKNLINVFVSSGEDECF